MLGRGPGARACNGSPRTESGNGASRAGPRGAGSGASESPSPSFSVPGGAMFCVGPPPPPLTCFVGPTITCSCVGPPMCWPALGKNVRVLVRFRPQHGARSDTGWVCGLSLQARGTKNHLCRIAHLLPVLTSSLVSRISPCRNCAKTLPVLRSSRVSAPRGGPRTHLRKPYLS